MQQQGNRGMNLSRRMSLSSKQGSQGPLFVTNTPFLHRKTFSHLSLLERGNISEFLGYPVNKYPVKMTRWDLYIIQRIRARGYQPLDLI